MLVDFWAPWCVPCAKVEPMVEELGERLAGRLAVGAVDIDAEPGVAGRYQVLSLPTLILFKGGAAVERISGLPKRERLETLVERHL